MVCKSAALHVALVAMLLRALLPAGWMPNPVSANASPFVICTMQGPLAPAKPAPAHDRANAPCVFAAAAPLSAPEMAAATPAPVRLALTIAFPPSRAEFARDEFFQPNAARAPPAFA